MNSAETFVDIFSTHEDKKRTVTWLSESGVLELFIFGNSIRNKGPKRVLQKLAIISGYPSMPPYFSLGFHYSKWEPISTKYTLNLLNQFDRLQIPLDVLWLDIEYATGKRYFQFDKDRFADVELLTSKIQELEKKLTVITDPHIKSDSSFFVYAQGMKYPVANDITGLIEKGVFIRD